VGSQRLINAIRAKERKMTDDPSVCCFEDFLLVFLLVFIGTPLKKRIKPYIPAMCGDRTPYRFVSYEWGGRRRVASA
jgi:hypothetical protein